ncbi:ABC transporter substrate-binding protein [Jiangella gansuensis]|uniref:ABC transporter substrate-binding protein n=1 Tax=Jiangella gansuensis TaxID=281473 RepID=UPI00047ACFE1|nr:ABC transporter substrate-binding protein [Jiangella gansuensis]
MHRRIAGLAGLAAAAVVLAACSSLEEEQSGGDAAAVLRVANPTPVTSLDPLGANSADLPTLTVTQHVFDTLVVREGTDLVPSLATEWTNPDDLTWQFTLRDDVVFADGTPLTSADVKASLDALIAAAGPLAGTWSAVASVETPDDTTLVITTSTPLGTLLSNLAIMPVVPSEKVTDQEFYRAPYGSGPYSVTQFTPGEAVVLERNPEYWGDAPAVEEISFQYIPEVSSRITALENDEIDFTWSLPSDQLGRFDGNEEFSVTTFPTYANYYIWFNSSREPLTDPRVRQALWHAVDLEAIHAALFDGVGEIATGPMPDDVFGAADNTPYAYDPDRARQLLAEAGYPDGFSTEMMWSTGCCANGEAFAQALISDWAKVGITVQPAPLERATWLERLLALDWDSTMSTGSTLTGDADFTLARLYLSSAERTGYANPELDTLLIEAREELDQDRRAELYAQAGAIIWNDAVGIFPLDLYGNSVASSAVQGFEPTPNDMPDFVGVSLD